MSLDPSLQNFIRHPEKFHLEMKGDNLKAVEGTPTVHQITLTAFEQLKRQAGSDKTANKVLSAIRQQQEGFQKTSLFSRISTAVGSLFSRTVPDKFKRSLQEWCEKKIGTPEYSSRITALQKMEHCHVKNNSFLDLSSLHLTSLPDCIGDLSGLYTLNLANNRLTSLPDLIGNLSHLRRLDLSHNRFTSFPNVLKKLPASCEIYASGNQLISDEISLLYELPSSTEAHPDEVSTDPTDDQILEPSTVHNETHIESAENPDVSGILFEDLTRSLQAWCEEKNGTPEHRQRLIARQKIESCYNNRDITLELGSLGLTSLPDCIGNLPDVRNLFISDNELTVLPYILARLSARCYLFTIGNPISSAAEQMFRDEIARAHAENPHLGPRFIFSPPNSQTSTVTPILHSSIGSEFIHDVTVPVSFKDTLALWLKDFQKAFPKANEEVWNTRSADRFPDSEASESSFLAFYEPLLSHGKKQLLNTFLIKLRKTRDFESPATRNNVIFRMHRILNGACQNEAFRQQLFPILDDALSTCGDRVSLAFNQIELQWRLYCEAPTLEDTQLARLLIGSSRIGLLDKIATIEIKHRRTHLRPNQTIDDIEEIEIFLHYQVKLKEALKLPISTEGMLYPASSDITEAQLLKAKEDVLRQTSNPEAIAKILSESELWADRMKAHNPKEFDAINEEISDKMTELTEDASLSEGEQLSRQAELFREQKERTQQLVEAISLSWALTHRINDI